MLTVNQLSFSFPQKELYQNICFHLETGQHAAFIGASGSGKSTLVEMILDEDKFLYDGKITLLEGTNIGYVPQLSQKAKHKKSVVEYLGETYYALQKQLDDICLLMESGENLEKHLENYQDIMDQIDILGGHEFEAKMHKKLHDASLTSKANQSLCTLSGGERKLVEFVKAMLDYPQMLILDEPDVFLDFNHLISLKNLINHYKGTLMVITHHRYLLNHCFNKIIHLENGSMNEFDGSYADYQFELLTNKIETQELAVADEQEILRNEALIDRLRFIATNFANPSCGRALKARVKIQERLEKRKINAPYVSIQEPNIHLFTENPVQAEQGISLKDYTLSFDETLLKKVDLEILPTDKVAIFGGNGSGKTSLLKDILTSSHTQISLHPDLKLGYLPQNHHESLDGDETVKEYLINRSFDTYEEVKRFVRQVGFSPDVLKQKISKLSGGEQTTLQLAKLTKEGSNFLLLDEPTSHLDTYSQMALEKAIKNYNGGFLLVSHDYYTLAHCVDYVLMIENQNIRKITVKKFKKMISKNYFDKEYIENDKLRNGLALKIQEALSEVDFEKAKLLAEELQNFSAS